MATRKKPYKHKCDTKGTITVSGPIRKKNRMITTATVHCSICGLPTKVNRDKYIIATDIKRMRDK